MSEVMEIVLVRFKVLALGGFSYTVSGLPITLGTAEQLIREKHAVFGPSLEDEIGQHLLLTQPILPSTINRVLQDAANTSQEMKARLDAHAAAQKVEAKVEPLKMSRPIHPGEVLYDEFMKPRHLWPESLARRLGVRTRTVYDIVHERGGVTRSMADLLGQEFGTTAEFWLNLQSAYERDVAREKSSG